jgi:hypothetical protein
VTEGCNTEAEESDNNDVLENGEARIMTNVGQKFLNPKIFIIKTKCHK